VNIINFFVGLIVFAAVLIFFYESHTLNDTPQRLNVKDTYFISFTCTQLIALAFFFWDKDPYAHSLWHLFAFVSLGSAIAHIHENDDDVKRNAFYILGSIPSRLFVSAILIHWSTANHPTNLPVVLGTYALALVMLFKPIRDLWKGGRNYFLLLHGMSYIVIALFLTMEIENNALIAGVWLILDTLLSLYFWYNRGKVIKTETQPQKYKKLQLHNLRF
jgi:hypothetical protein